MKNRSVLFLSLLIIFIISGCRTYHDPQMYYTYEPRAIAANSGDSYVLRVQGKGQSKADAINNALMQAVRDVIFKDIQVTYGDHKMLMRLINNPSVEEQNSKFFNHFFSHKGEYLQFVSPINKNQEVFSSPTGKTVLINVTIDRKALKDYLVANGIL